MPVIEDIISRGVLSVERGRNALFSLSVMSVPDMLFQVIPVLSHSCTSNISPRYNGTKLVAN
jgi:hypothetical protein